LIDAHTLTVLPPRSAIFNDIQDRWRLTQTEWLADQVYSQMATALI
jgi:hypothetical protein